MSSKNFMAYGDAETILTGFANKINANTKGVAEQKVLLPATVGWTGKNKLPLDITTNSAATITVNNGSVTVASSGNEAGWINFFGSSANTDYLVLSSDCVMTWGNINLDTGKMSITAEKSDGTRLDAAHWSTSLNIPAGSYKRVWLYINNTYSKTLTFYPMIADKRITDSTYEPYHKSVEECLEELDVRLSTAEEELDTKNYLVDDFELGSINSTTGQNENASDRVRTKEYIPVEKSTTYYYQKDVNSGGFYIFLYDASMNLTRFIDGNGSGGTFTTSATECYVRFRWTASSVDTVKGYHPMLSIGSNKQTFVPYKRDYDLRLNDILSYLETTATLSTSGTTTVTFTSAKITTSSCVEVGISEWGLVPDDVTVSAGSCTVTLPQVDSAHSVTVRLYVR